MDDTVTVTLADGQRWEAPLASVDACLARYWRTSLADLQSATRKAFEAGTAELHSAPDSRMACLVILAGQPSDLLDTAGVAELLGITAKSVREQRSRGLLPKPDALDGRSPLWRPETITAWQASRPGRGRRQSRT